MPILLISVKCKPKVMDATQLKVFCEQFAGATWRLLGHPSNILVYSIGDKNFAYFKTSDPERWRFSIRVSPDRFVELTDIPGIKPARYRGRYHWVTIVDVRSVPVAYLTELVTWSYNKALGSLSRTRRAGLIG